MPRRSHRRPPPWLVALGCLGVLAALLAGPLPGGSLPLVLPLGAVALLVGHRWLLPGRTSGRRGAPRRLQHQERLRLSQGSELHLVSAGDRQLLLAVSPGRVQVIARWAAEPQVPPPQTQGVDET